MHHVPGWWKLRWCQSLQSKDGPCKRATWPRKCHSARRGTNRASWKCDAKQKGESSRSNSAGARMTTTWAAFWQLPLWWTWWSLQPAKLHSKHLSRAWFCPRMPSCLPGRTTVGWWASCQFTVWRVASGQFHWRHYQHQKCRLPIDPARPVKLPCSWRGIQQCTSRPSHAVQTRSNTRNGKVYSITVSTTRISAVYHTSHHLRGSLQLRASCSMWPVDHQQWLARPIRSSYLILLHHNWQHMSVGSRCRHLVPLFLHTCMFKYVVKCSCMYIHLHTRR